MHVLTKFLAGFALVASLATSAVAQEVVVPPPKPDALGDPAGPDDGRAVLDDPAPLDGLAPPAPIQGAIAPAVSYAPAITPDTGMPAPSGVSPVYLVARLSEDSPSLTRGVSWRVYADKPGEDGKLELVATATGGDADFRLEPGTYIVHTGFGFAGRTSRIAVNNGVTSQTVLLNAGGMKLDAQFSGHMPIATGRVRFDIYEREFDNRGERRLVAGNIAPGEVVRLNADTYHVVSRYGAVNAIVRADIHVEPGKLTEATVYHNAARVTLKLVNQRGGEALANTAWSVLTPGGDVVAEGNGAFPAFTLASGEYQVIARNADKIYSRNFMVKTAEHGEVEVLTSSVLEN